MLDVVAKKHRVSISNVATRWVLQQAAIGGANMGSRLGYTQHVDANKRVFSFALDAEDLAAIDAIRGRGKGLMNVFGNCGGECRG